MRVLLVASMLAASVLAAGCDQIRRLTGQDGAVSFKNTDITGASFAQGFTLTDHTGKQRTLEDFAGKVVVVFFGFTQCPDVCPGTLIEMKNVIDQIGEPDANRVQVLFISVDPERDSQQVLAQYVPAFDKRFLGLRGDDAATKKVAKEFKVFYNKVPGKSADTYSVDHTALSYAFDTKGRVRLMIRYGAQREGVVNDLKQLLKG